MNKKFDSSAMIFALSIVVILAAVLLFPHITNAFFDKEHAYSYLEKQLSFGPRVPGTDAHQAFIEWASGELKQNGWEVSLQTGTYKERNVINIVASRESQPANPDAEWILLGAHYDSREFATAEKDMNARLQPVPGANDGASGVAVLMELAYSLPKELNKKVTLVLFDAEDQGDITGWDEWCVGSKMMAKSLVAAEKRPDAVVVVDMVGDRSLNIHREQNSDQRLTDEIWQTAADEGFADAFINQPKYSIYDDHIPFLEVGIPAVDIIDFDYPAWHTLADTAENVSSESLATVGSVLYAWLTK